MELISESEMEREQSARRGNSRGEEEEEEEEVVALWQRSGLGGS